MLHEHRNHPKTEPSSADSLPNELTGEAAVDTEQVSQALYPLRMFHPDALVRLGTSFGIGMIGLALLWINVFRGDNISNLLTLNTIGQLIPGMLIGIGFAIPVWFIGNRLPQMQQITELLEATINLKAMQPHHIILIGLAAAIPEEMLFRGAVQGQFGLIMASLIFGTLHAISFTYFIYATLAGLLLGGLFILTGSLWLPIGAHFAIDVVMFWLLMRRHQTPRN